MVADRVLVLQLRMGGGGIFAGNMVQSPQKRKKPGEPGGSLKTTSAFSLVVIRCGAYNIPTGLPKSIG